MNHDDWQTELRQQCAREVELPTEKHLRVSGPRGAVQLWLSEKAVCQNMQHDWAAFEGWALALLTWGQAGHVELDWKVPEKVNDLHYQRFLYRVARFCDFMPGEVSVRHRALLGALRFQPDQGRFVLNAARGRDTSTPVAGSEAALEKQLATDGHPSNVLLKQRHGLHTVDRQFPVGVFKGVVGRDGDKPVFPRGKSAIDLVGLDDAGDFWLIELKLKDNRKVGAVSELFFYSMILRDLQHRRLHCDVTPGARATLWSVHVTQNRRLRALLLMEAGGPTMAVHPLVGDKVLPLLSKRVGSIDYQWATIP